MSPRLLVCHGPACRAAGAEAVARDLARSVAVGESGCRSACEDAVVALAEPERRLLRRLRPGEVGGALAALAAEGPARPRRGLRSTPAASAWAAWRRWR